MILWKYRYARPVDIWIADGKELSSKFPDRDVFETNSADIPTSMSKPMPPPTRPRILGIHHLKFAVSNLSLSLAWYERVLGAQRISTLDHFRPDGDRFAVVCEMQDWAGLFLELRDNAVKALDDRSWDPVTLAVHSRQDLNAWAKWLDTCGTKHSAVLTGMRGWLIVFEVRLKKGVVVEGFQMLMAEYRIRTGEGSGCIVQKTTAEERSLRTTSIGLMKSRSVHRNRSFDAFLAH